MEEAIRIFFNQYFRCNIFTKDRNKAAIDRKRLVSLFLMKETSLSLTTIATIMNIKHSSVIHLKNENVDVQFQKFYNLHVTKLHDEFSEFIKSLIENAKDIIVNFC